MDEVFNFWLHDYLRIKVKAGLIFLLLSQISIGSLHLIDYKFKFNYWRNEHIVNLSCIPTSTIEKKGNTKNSRGNPNSRTTLHDSLQLERLSSPIICYHLINTQQNTSSHSSSSFIYASRYRLQKHRRSRMYAINKGRRAYDITKDEQVEVSEQPVAADSRRATTDHEQAIRGDRSSEKRA